MQKNVYRLIDANLNRLKEGLRVVEDIVRFVYGDASLTASLKEIRHDCSRVMVNFPVPYRKMVATRESNHDVGKRSQITDQKRPEWQDLLTRNLKRAEESLRVLEEVSKMVAPTQSPRFQSLRFKVYGLEKKVLKKF